MSTEYKPLPDFLDSLRGEGQIDSEGVITIDRERAARLTAKYRFQSPYQYVLKFIQAAVASGAPEIEATCRFSKVRLKFPSVLCSFEEWEEFLERRLTDSDSLTGVLKLIDVGLNAASVLNPQMVKVAVWDAEEETGFHYALSGDRYELARLPSRFRKNPSMTTISVERSYKRYGWQRTSPYWSSLRDFTHRDLFDLHHEMKANVDSEFSQIWRHCLFSPIPIVLNWIAVNRPVFGLPKTNAVMRKSEALGSKRFLNITPTTSASRISRSATVLCDRRDHDVIPAPSSYEALRSRLERNRFWFEGENFPHAIPERLEASYQRARMLSERSSPPCHFRELSMATNEHGFLAAELYMGRQTGLFASSEGWLGLVQNGVLIEQIRGRDVGLGGWMAIASAANLETDLTGFQVLRNDRFESLKKSIKRIVEAVG